jgi:hypothetical protein
MIRTEVKIHINIISNQAATKNMEARRVESRELAELDGRAALSILRNGARPTKETLTAALSVVPQSSAPGSSHMENIMARRLEAYDVRILWHPRLKVERGFLRPLTVTSLEMEGRLATFDYYYFFGTQNTRKMRDWATLYENYSEILYPIIILQNRASTLEAISRKTVVETPEFSRKKFAEEVLIVKPQRGKLQPEVYEDLTLNGIDEVLRRSTFDPVFQKPGEELTRLPNIEDLVHLSSSFETAP